MSFTPRKDLPHDIPPWVASGAIFFVTVVARDRAASRFDEPDRAAAILSPVRHYHTTFRWYSRLFLVMPDHVHGLLSFPAEERMQKTIQDWKRYAARTLGLEWQRDFFDHRVQSEENGGNVAEYMRMNPVRKGLIAEARSGPWIFEA